MDQAPYIPEVEKDLYIVRTTPSSMWYKGDDFNTAQEMCRAIKAVQEAHREVEATIRYWERVLGLA